MTPDYTTRIAELNAAVSEPENAQGIQDFLANAAKAYQLGLIIELHSHIANVEGVEQISYTAYLIDRQENGDQIVKKFGSDGTVSEWEIVSKFIE